MNITEVRNVIRQVIAEAKAEGGLPKSGGKLVHLKKELEGLKKMKESLGEYTINEGGDGSFVAEYAHMQKFVNELEKIKGLHAKLAEMLDSQISEVEGRVTSETQKVKEMMGLIEKAKAPKKAAAKKDGKKTPAKKEDKKEEPKKDEPKKAKELKEYYDDYVDQDDDEGRMSEYQKEMLFKQLTKLKPGSPSFNKIKKMLVPGEMADAEFDTVYKSMKLNESEFTYRKINGVCYKIDDENNRTKVSSQYCN
jgi:flagellar biosynthesis chaperone FliJ